MEMTNQDRTGRKVGFWHVIGRLACVGGIVLVGGCSTMEDIGDATTEGLSSVGNALNPVNWFDDDDDKATPTAEQKRTQASTAPKSGVKSAPRDALAQRRDSEREREKYPKLSSVPERPKQATSQRAKRDRQALRDGLVADTENAQYSDSVLRGQPAAPPSAAPSAVPAANADAARSSDRLAAASPRAVPPAPTASAPVVSPPVAAQPNGAAPSPVTAPAPPRAAVPQVRQQASAAVPQPAPVVPPAPSAVSNTPPPPVHAPGSAPSPRASTPQIARAPQTASRPTGPVAQQGVLKTVQVATIYFNNGSSRLSESDRRVIRQVASVVQQKNGRLRIIGHSSMGAPVADLSRRDRVNYKVSLDRANAVASELLRLGLQPNRLKIGAEGDRKPIYAETSPTGAAGNRRAEIYMDYVERR